MSSIFTWLAYKLNIKSLKHKIGVSIKKQAYLKRHYKVNPEDQNHQ